MDLYSFRSHADLGAPTGEGSSSWGWTDPESGREFVGEFGALETFCKIWVLTDAAAGAYEGTAMLEITKDGQIVKLGFL